MLRRIGIYLMLGINLALLFSSSVIAKNIPLKVGFILVGSISDLGWNYAHDQGRIFLESAMQGKVKSTLVENIPESAEVERIMEKLIAQGNKLIFATSYGYLEPALKVAARHPDVIIMQCQRSVPPSVKNVGTFFARQYEPMYAAGMVAGHMSKKGKLGYVGGHPVPPLIASLNAFILGAKSVNPKATISVIWINSWFDPAMETEATKGLIDSGVDVVLPQLETSLNVVKTCEKNGVFSIGSNGDISSFAPQGWLTGQKWNWGPLYAKIAQSVIDRTWKSDNKVYGVKDGYTMLSPFGSTVPISVRKEANSVMNRITKGEFVIFKGPLKDRDGHEKLKNGQALDDKALTEIDWVVDGVQGPLPKSK